MHADLRAVATDEARRVKAGFAKEGESEGQTHTLRHTLLSHLAMKRAPLRTIPEVAGHHHALSMTARYLHLTPTAKSEAMRLLEGAEALEKVSKKNASDVEN